jgi:hypothetical protein
MARQQSARSMKISPMAAGIAFTVVGAAAATTYAFSNEKMRKKMTDTFTDMKDTIMARFSDSYSDSTMMKSEHAPARSAKRSRKK